MISDVLHEAVSEIDRYLNEPVFRDTYTGQMRKELKALRTMMDSARQRLDAPPKQKREIAITVQRGVVMVKS